jgi:hypothetical protein
VKKFMTPDELLSTELGDIMIRLANFRASMAAEDSFGASQPVEILLQMDSDLEEWARALPLSWRHEVHTCVPRDDFYTTFYHKYQGFSIAAVWNQYRIARCLVSDHLLSYLDSSRSANQACDPFVLLKQCDQARTTIRKLCIDICASVPYFLCQRDQNDPPRPGVGALEVMWALFTCARMYCIPEEQRLWAIVQLDKIGHEMAVRLALSLANLIRLKGNPLESGSVFDPAWENCISINT